MHKTPKVNEINEFIEIASDFEDPLEVIREALSNSYDANATTVDIGIYQDENGTNTLIIQDDGDGMSEVDLPSFFDLGNSKKENAIGYKGHGTKIYYKSDDIRVVTVQDGVKITSWMEEPWGKLNDGELPTYSIESENTEQAAGTRIEVRGFRAGQGFDPKRLTYNKIEHYIAWKTIGGSTAWHFTDDFHEMEISVTLSPNIDDSRDQLEMTNKLEFPDENLNPSGEFVAEKMCKHYPPRVLTITDGEREYDLEIVGMVAGKEARNELPTWGKHSTMFGVWLAKDHIKVEQYNDAVGADNEFFHFFFIANCQGLELSSNREKIRNKSGEIYEAITNELDRFMTRVCQDTWYKDYIDRRKLEDKQRSVRKQRRTIEQRLERLKEENGFSPSNPPEVIAALERWSANGAPETVRIADFELDEEVNAIIETDDGFENGAITVKLSEFFEKEASLEYLNRIICWSLGDLDELTRIERSPYLGERIRFDFEEPSVQYGEERVIPIIELSQKLAE